MKKSKRFNSFKCAEMSVNLFSFSLGEKRRNNIGSARGAGGRGGRRKEENKRENQRGRKNSARAER